MAKKIKDSDISHELFDDFDRFEHFAINNWKKIIYFCCAAVLLVAAGAIAMAISNSMEAKAVSAIAGAETAADISKVLKEYSGHPAANNARLRLASLYSSQKEYDKALEQYQFLVNANVPDVVRQRAEMNIAYIWELQGNKEKAAVKFAEIGANSILPEAVRSEANYSAGRIYASIKSVNKAIPLLESAYVNKPRNSSSVFWRGQAKLLLERLKSASDVGSKG
ncbi:MAG: hypothetical protein A2017_08800 [Lentisphaerae bacterium GWF2_44_16]|nr:MAG: hypothetical protein A2017_08800 [Lentisphaerae bacterium GWF2_44_16]